MTEKEKNELVDEIISTFDNGAKEYTLYNKSNLYKLRKKGLKKYNEDIDKVIELLKKKVGDKKVTTQATREYDIDSGEYSDYYIGIIYVE